MVCTSISYMIQLSIPLPFFFFNDTATTEIYTLSLHDALPIFKDGSKRRRGHLQLLSDQRRLNRSRSEEHTSELQSRLHLVCRLLLEKKKNTPTASVSFSVSAIAVSD